MESQGLVEDKSRVQVQAQGQGVGRGGLGRDREGQGGTGMGEGQGGSQRGAQSCPTGERRCALALLFAKISYCTLALDFLS